MDEDLKNKGSVQRALRTHQHDKVLENADEELHDETDAEGSMPEPEGYNVLDEAQEMGLYEEADEEHPTELGLADQIMRDEEKQWEE